MPRRRTYLASAIAVSVLLVAFATAWAAVSVTSPSAGTVVHKQVKIEVKSDRAEGYVTIFLDDAFLGSAAYKNEAVRLNADVGKAKDGAHLLRVVDHAADGRVVGETSVSIQVVVSPPRDFVENGVLLENRLGPGEYSVAVGGMANVTAAKATVPEAMRLLTLALSAQVRDEVTGSAGEGLLALRRTVERGFSQRWQPDTETYRKADLVETGHPVAFLLAGNGLPRYGSPGPKPFVLGLPTLSLPGVRMKVGGSWSAPMAVVADLTGLDLRFVVARHRLSAFQWFDEKPCAVIESVWEASGSLTVLLGDRPFTFSEVKTTGKRTSLFDYGNGRFLGAREQIDNRITLSGAELEALRAMGGRGRIVEGTDANFEQEVLRSSVPVLVEFTTDWCVHTPKAEPFVRGLASQFAGSAKIAQVDAEKSPRSAAAYNVTAYPTFQLFVGGQVRYSRVSGWYDAWANELAAVLTSAITGATGMPAAPAASPAATYAQPAAAYGPGAARGRGKKSETDTEAPVAYSPPAPAAYAPPATTYAQPPAAGPAAPAVGFGGRRGGGMSMSMGALGLGGAPAASAYGQPSGYGTAATPYQPGQPGAYAPAGMTPGASARPVEVTEASFIAEVLQATVPLVAYFYSEAAPRPDIDQALLAALSAYAPNLKVARAGISGSPNLAAQYAQNGQPTLVLFSSGRVLAGVPADAPVVQQLVNMLLQNRLIAPPVPGTAGASALPPEKLEVTYSVQISTRVN